MKKKTVKQINGPRFYLIGHERADVSEIVNYWVKPEEPHKFRCIFKGGAGSNSFTLKSPEEAQKVVRFLDNIFQPKRIR